MKHRTGDLFTTDSKIIAHGANISGVMGAGVAATVKTKFPKNFNGYKAYCDNGFAQPGEWYANNQDRDGLLILNLFSQDAPGPNARYEWIFSSTMDFLRFYNGLNPIFGTTIAVPQIGAGIGGLKWGKVEAVLKTVEVLNEGYEFEVWTL